MKKAVVSIISLIALAGCATYYDYYHADVRYTQDGEDCVYYLDESGRRFSDDVRSKDLDKKIVYRNTRCADLFSRDNADVVTHSERKVLNPVKTSETVYDFGACSKKTKQYILVGM